jgi:hypothetical protein
MGRKRPEKGGRRGPGRRGGPSRDQQREDPSHNRAGPGAGAQEPARLRLTRVIREGVIWEVFVATTAQSGARNLTQLEFEATGPDRRRLRYARTVEGALLDALHTGAPLSRASVQQQLELAIRDAEATGDEDTGSQ